MISKVNMGKIGIKGKVVTHFYIVLDTCKFHTQAQIHPCVSRGKQETNFGKMLHSRGIPKEVACPLLGLASS
jgi:hypothetical protein